jgi:hypothetical protein
MTHASCECHLLVRWNGPNFLLLLYIKHLQTLYSTYQLLPFTRPLPHPAHVDTLPAADLLLLPAHCPPSGHGNHLKTSSIPVKVGFASFNN